MLSSISEGLQFRDYQMRVANVRIAKGLLGFDSHFARQLPPSISPDSTFPSQAVTSESELDVPVYRIECAGHSWLMRNGMRANLAIQSNRA
jgi:hypothetical protein